MESMPFVFQYFGYTISTTAIGILYWLAIENFQPIELKQKEFHKLGLIFILSLLISPLGVWIVSLVVRTVKVRKLALSLKETNKTEL